MSKGRGLKGMAAKGKGLSAKGMHSKAMRTEGLITEDKGGNDASINKETLDCKRYNIYSHPNHHNSTAMNTSGRLIKTPGQDMTVTLHDSMDCERLGTKVLCNFTGVTLSWIIICVGILGLIGNILSAIVLIRKYKRSPRVLLLTTLAMTDLCFLFFTIMDQAMTHIGLEVPLHAAWKFSLGILASYCSIITIWMVVLVTIDRFIHICMPFKALTLCTWKSTVVLIISMVTFCIVLVTVLFAIVLKNVNIGEQCWFLGLDLHSRFAETSVAPLFIYQAFAYAIPPISITIFNVLILRQVCKCKPVEEGMPSIDDKQVSYILITISISSLCLILPSAILQFMSVRDLKNVVAILLVMNSSINFIIYNAVGRIFRDKLFELWCGRKDGNQRINKKSKSNTSGNGEQHV
ncbi:unnamed protein product [Owenia fusiformis]|uniref:G-protein coupled receptors family 1 profile domain-containing protein n=1 Tax=Owenia fusiformis TaxID=6347 RepID=A0A8S4N4Q4_OWEFU|nr:unnamed protein product [Owenia fusiformis]